MRSRVDRLSSSERGARFEEIVAQKLKQALQSRRLGLLPESAAVYRKKAYFSKDRGAAIVVDVSIELTLPGANTWSILWVWECKDHARPLAVGAVEEFYSKLTQIGGANVIGGLACSGPLQCGALEYAKSKGIAVARIQPDKNIEMCLNLEHRDLVELTEIREKLKALMPDEEAVIDDPLRECGFSSLEALIENAISAQPYPPRLVIDSELAIERVANWLGERSWKLNEQPIRCSYLERVLGLAENGAVRVLTTAGVRFGLFVKEINGDWVTLGRHAKGALS